MFKNASKLPRHTICVQIKTPTPVFLDPKPLNLTISPLFSLESKLVSQEIIVRYREPGPGEILKMLVCVCVCACVLTGGQVSGAREVEQGGQRPWDLITQESTVFCEGSESLPTWLRGKRKWDSLTMTPQSASLGRTPSRGCREGRIKEVKSLSLKDGANYL